MTRIEHTEKVNVTSTCFNPDPICYCYTTALLPWIIGESFNSTTIVIIVFLLQTIQMLFEKSKYASGYKMTLCPVRAAPRYQSVRTIFKHIMDIYKYWVPIGGGMKNWKKSNFIVLKEDMMYPKYCSWREHHIVKSMVLKFSDM